MERITLAPQTREIIVNGSAAESVADIFSYGTDEPASANLGSLYVIGSHDNNSSAMNYMVSLVAAMARREYYAQPGTPPRDAFARALRKVNEVVEEFFRSEGVQLSVGIIGIAGATVMVSKLDKFRILLARNGEIIDILNNVLLFNKEHLERRRFSSIIHGAVQPGDRLLAYIPSRTITAREKALKGWLVDSDGDVFAQQCAALGDEHRTFSASFLHIDIAAGSEAPAPQQRREQPERQELAQQATLAWSPRQHGSTDSPLPPVVDEETPQIIPSEFSHTSRKNTLARLVGALRLMRLDGRGKAAVLGVVAVIVIGTTLAAKSLWFVSPEEQQLRATITSVSGEFQAAQEQAKTEPAQARRALIQALGTLKASGENNNEVKDLTANIVAAIDTIDHAEEADIAAVMELSEKNDRIVLAAWSSTSHTIWAVTTAEKSSSVVQIENEAVKTRVALPAEFTPSLLAGWRDGALVLDATSRTLQRISGGTATSFTLPTQETPLDMAVFDGNLYVLTNASILKVSALDTNKPVTKLWLTDVSELAPHAARILVDGNVWTMGTDGALTTYYKGKRTVSTITPLTPSQNWRLVPAGSNVALANADRMRIYVVSPADGTLVRTLKIDSEQSFVTMFNGPDDTFFFVTHDNRIWSAQ